MSDSWLTSLESLIDRWKEQAGPVQLAPAADFGVQADVVPGDTGDTEDTGETAARFEIAPALAELSRDGRAALVQLAEAIRTSMSELAGAVRDSAAGGPPEDESAGGEGEIAAQMASLRAEVKAALFQLGALANRVQSGGGVSAPAVDTQALVEALKPHLAGGEAPAPVAAVDPEAYSAPIAEALTPLIESVRQESRSGRSELMDQIRNALAEFSEEDMVGRAGLAKSLKIGMADLAEKNRRSLAEIKEMLSGASGGAGDTVTFHPEPVPDQAFATAGEVGAFPRPLSEGAARRISLGDCYAAQVNDDSMAPLACEGQTLLVSRSLPVRNGDMVIAQLADGRWVFKRYVLREGQHQLQSTNPVLGLPAVVLTEPPQQLHAVVGVVFGRALARVPQGAAASSATAGAAGQ